MTIPSPSSEQRTNSVTVQQKAVVSTATFKKRLRPSASKQRKRLLNSLDSTSTVSTFDPEHAQPSSSASLAEPKHSTLKPNRLRETFENFTEVPSLASNATAERLDVGGITSTTAKRKPFGPVRAPAHLRASVRVDYQPDVCKDYKETGYCGFGDACKFLHDRSDYKAGWQLDRDWSTRQENRRRGLFNATLHDDDPSRDNGNVDSAHLDDDGLPFACFICRDDFRSPVMTLCGHYFCEDCALSRMEKEGTCAVCRKQMRGTFNAAPKLVAKLKLKRESEPGGA